jgi:hypothetical protein
MPGNTYKDWIVGRKVARGAPADYQENRHQLRATRSEI